jgi:hypothetical protein
VLCSKCSTNLPEGSEFCLKCGQAIKIAVGVTSAPAPLCGKCGTELPEASQFCLKCGQPVTTAGALATTALVEGSADAATSARAHAPTTVRRRSRPKTAIWLIGLMLPIIAWVVFSNDSGAEQVREFVTMSHTETITEADFPVKPHSFSSFKFTVPPGAIRVSIKGQFSTKEGSSNDMEVYVLTDEAFAAWQSGYSTDTYYDSGRASQGDIEAKLPSGGGAYYLVFRNESAVRTSKTIHAFLSCHYNRWWPEIFLHLR